MGHCYAIFVVYSTLFLSPPLSVIMYYTCSGNGDHLPDVLVLLGGALNLWTSQGKKYIIMISFCMKESSLCLFFLVDLSISLSH